jgi:putative membrane protein
MMWYWGGGMHWWGWLLGFVGMVLFFALVIWVIWYVINGMTGRSPAPREPSDAKRILDERLARGDIDSDEYMRLLGLIRGDQSSSRGDSADRQPVG